MSIRMMATAVGLLVVADAMRDVQANSALMKELGCLMKPEVPKKTAAASVPKMVLKKEIPQTGNNMRVYRIDVLRGKETPAGKTNFVAYWKRAGELKDAVYHVDLVNVDLHGEKACAEAVYQLALGRIPLRMPF